MRGVDILLGEPVRPITRPEYDRMVQAGVFDENERIELLRGMLVPMSPHGEGRAYVIRQLTMVLVEALHRRARVSPQLPLALLDDSEPEPDLALVPADTGKAHPSSAYLVIEVADSSIRRDRAVKVPLYAEGGVPEYWIVNLREETIEVYRQPRSGHYTHAATFGRGQSVTIEAFSDITFAVDEILPPRE